MVAQCHQISARIQHNNLQIKPPILDHLSLQSHKQPLNPLLWQRLLHIQVQQHRRIPKPNALLLPQLLTPASLLLKTIRILLEDKRLHNLRKRINHRPQRLIRPILAIPQTQPLVNHARARLPGPRKPAANIIRRFAEIRKRPALALAPIRVSISFEPAHVRSRGRRLQSPGGFERDALLGGDVGVRDVADDFLAAVLGERDVDDGGLAAEFDVFDFEGCEADLRAAEEV